VRVTAIENHVGIDDLIEKLDAAGRIGSDIVCTYEFVWIRGGPDEQVRQQTQQAQENLRRIREKAKQHGMYVLVGGVVDRLERNEAILYDRQGNEAGRYFKIVPPTPSRFPARKRPCWKPISAGSGSASAPITPTSRSTGPTG
jgi:predicted amidohydrolase